MNRLDFWTSSKNRYELFSNKKQTRRHANMIQLGNTCLVNDFYIPLTPISEGVPVASEIVPLDLISRKISKY